MVKNWSMMTGIKAGWRAPRPSEPRPTPPNANRPTPPQPGPEGRRKLAGASHRNRPRQLSTPAGAAENRGFVTPPSFACPVRFRRPFRGGALYHVISGGSRHRLISRGPPGQFDPIRRQLLHYVETLCCISEMKAAKRSASPLSTS